VFAQVNCSLDRIPFKMKRRHDYIVRTAY
jgi:hypothetical protein